MRAFYAFATRFVPAPVALRILAWVYPPWFGTAMRITDVDTDLRSMTIRMPLRWYNRNLVGTQFGGSLYSVCDPWFMVMLMANLGRQFIVWDKSGTVHYRAPGRGAVTATFRIPNELVAELQRELAEPGSKRDVVLHTDLRDDDGRIIAQVEKTLYVRRKPARKSS